MINQHWNGNKNQIHLNNNKMADEQLKQKLLTELVNIKGIDHKNLLEIFNNNQEKLNLIAKEFELLDLAKTTKTDQIGVIQMNVTRKTKDFLDNGGF